MATLEPSMLGRFFGGRTQPSMRLKALSAKNSCIVRYVVWNSDTKIRVTVDMFIYFLIYPQRCNA